MILMTRENQAVYDGQLLIYVAGPYTPHDMSNIDVAQRELEENVRIAVDAATDIIRKGHIPFIPHTHTQGFALRTSLEQNDELAEQLYYRWDDVILARCDAIYLVAHSPGADNEWDLAGELGLLQFRFMEEIPTCRTSQPETGLR